MTRLAILLLCFVAVSRAWADWEIVYDNKVAVRLAEPRFTSGTRPLAWLAEPPKDKAKKPAAGPEHVEFREEQSTLFKEGIVTFVPVESVARIDYDHAKKAVTLVYVQADGKEATLAGSTKFVGVNKFNVEGVAQAVQVTIPAGKLQVQDGLLKSPIQGIRLHGEASKAKPVPAPTGRAATVIAQDKEKTEHRVLGLTPLYRVGAGQRLAPVLMFQKIGQIDVAKIAALAQLAPAKKQAASSDYEITLVGGKKETLTLLDKTALDDNQPAQLLGLVARTTAGWKLFPPHTIAAVRWED
jgi:hypothetical protein